MDDLTTTLADGAGRKFGGRYHDTISTILIIILAPVIALILTNFVFQSYQVDGPSMETTLQNQDRLIVSKTGKTWARISGGDYIPKRYEVVIFNLKENGENKQLIKRIIGLPGDKVIVRNGVVTIFNAEHPEGYEPDKVGPEAPAITTTPGNVEKTVGKGEVFVMGDNRENSLDSRSFGTVPADNLVGKLKYRIFPFEKFDSF